MQDKSEIIVIDVPEDVGRRIKMETTHFYSDKVQFSIRLLTTHTIIRKSKKSFLEKRATIVSNIKQQVNSKQFCRTLWST